MNRSRNSASPNDSRSILNHRGGLSHIEIKNETPPKMRLDQQPSIRQLKYGSRNQNVNYVSAERMTTRSNLAMIPSSNTYGTPHVDSTDL